MDHVSIIEARLRACASTGPIFLTKSERGILSEWWVARDRVSRFGETLIGHREKTPFAEIDLFFAPRNQRSERMEQDSILTLIEVKSWVGDLWRRDLVSHRQILRLQRARLHLESRFERPVRLLLAVVTDPASGARPQIRYFDDLCGA